MFISEVRTLEEKINEIKELGICSTCNHLETCIRNGIIKKAVWYCEEFDDYLPPSQSSMMAKAGSMEVNPVSERKLTPELKGLCINCYWVEDCILPKPETGVWHCNEYL